MAKNQIKKGNSEKVNKDIHSNFFVKSSEKKGFYSKSKHTNVAENKNSFGDKRKSQNIRKVQDSSEENVTNSTKKPFDKKTYRLKKYSKKFKVQQWEDTRKKAVLKDYYRQVKDPDQKFDVTRIYDDPRNRDSDDDNLPTNTTPTTSITKIVEVNKSSGDDTLIKKKKPFQKAQEHFNRLKDEKQKKREEFLKVKAEREEALKKYRKEKSIKSKRLSRKTKRGQPIMKDRIEMLLEKIQKSVN